MHIIQIKKIMTEKKKFLILAMGMGVTGVIIGGLIIWNLLTTMTNP